MDDHLKMLAMLIPSCLQRICLRLLRRMVNQYTAPQKIKNKAGDDAVAETKVVVSIRKAKYAFELSQSSVLVFVPGKYTQYATHISQKRDIWESQLLLLPDLSDSSKLGNHLASQDVYYC